VPDVDGRACLHRRRTILSCTGKPVHDDGGRTILSRIEKSVHEVGGSEEKARCSPGVSSSEEKDDARFRRKAVSSSETDDTIVHWETSARFGGSQVNGGEEKKWNDWVEVKRKSVVPRLVFYRRRTLWTPKHFESWSAKTCLGTRCEEKT
jgi:hypothetical protein